MQQNTREVMNAIGRVLSQYIGGYGFALMVFDLENPASSAYVSNVDRLWMIEALRAAANRLERDGDEIGPVVGSA